MSMVRCLLALAALLALTRDAAASDAIYRDTTWHFQIAIAPGWMPKPISGGTSAWRLIVQGQPPLGKKEMCYVKVNRVPELDGKPQAELDREVRGGLFKPARPAIAGLVPIRPPYALPRANVLKEAIVDLHGQAAQFIEFDYEPSGLNGRKAQMYVLLFQAPGRIYEAGCFAESDLYPQLRPVFEHMLRSIVIGD